VKWDVSGQSEIKIRSDVDRYRIQKCLNFKSHRIRPAGTTSCIVSGFFSPLHLFSFLVIFFHGRVAEPPEFG
jgi:hypothetical protein